MAKIEQKRTKYGPWEQKVPEHDNPGRRHMVNLNKKEKEKDMPTLLPTDQNNNPIRPRI